MLLSLTREVQNYRGVAMEVGIYEGGGGLDAYIWWLLKPSSNIEMRVLSEEVYISKCM